MRLLYRLNKATHLPLLIIVLTIGISSQVRGESIAQTNPDAANASLTVQPSFSPENEGLSYQSLNESGIAADSVKFDSHVAEYHAEQKVNADADALLHDQDVSENIAPESMAGVDEASLEDEGQLLVLKVTSKGYIMSHALAAYERGDQFFVSLFDMSDALMFPIEVYDEEKRAEGWFISEENDFYLNIDAGQLIIAGREREIGPDKLIVNEDGIFISSAALKDWFGIDSTLNYAQMKLDITAEGRLNFEEIVAREKRWESQKNKRVVARKVYPYVDTPYELAEFPSMTFQLGSTYASLAGETDISGSYSAQGVGDLLYMSSDYFVTGNDIKKLSDARIRLYRYDESGKALEALGATQFELGDISPPSINNIGGGGNERGLYVTNRGLDSVTAPDNFLLDGEVEPGWEVELYRNTEFIAFRDSSTTADGRYEFTGLSLDAGNNIFKIVKYGPHGEKETEFRKFVLGGGMLKPGQWHYDFSVSQPNQQIIPLADQDYDLAANARLIAGVEYGVLDTLSLGAGVYSGPLFNDTQHHGATISLRNSLWGVYSRVDHLQNLDNSSVTTFSQKKSVFDINLSSFLTYYRGFDASEQDLELVYDSSLGKSLDIFGLPLSIRIGGQYEKYQSGRETTTYDNQLSTSVFGYSFSNQLNWVVDDNQGSQSETMTGELFFREFFEDKLFGSKYGVLFRANLDYQVKPLAELTNINIGAEKNISEHMRVGLGYTKSLNDTKSWAATGRASYDHDYFITDVSMQYNSEGDYTIGSNLRFNFGYDHAQQDYGVLPVRDAGRGTVTAFVYHDVNYNGQYDSDDIALEDVRFKTDNGRSGLSNAAGLAVINRQTGFRKTDLVLDSNSLPDIFLVPVREGLQYMPRPGHLSHFEFAVVMGGEIDGEILATDAEQGKLFDFSDVQVELVDRHGTVIKTVEADPTGYFLFEQVVPDEYRVRLAADNVSGLQLVQPGAIDVLVPKDDPMVNGLEIQVIVPWVGEDEVYGPVDTRVRRVEPSESVADPADAAASPAPSEGEAAPAAGPVHDDVEVVPLPEQRYTDQAAAPYLPVDTEGEHVLSGPTP